jgi:hypothetical protein
VELAFSPARFFEPVARRRMGGDLSQPGIANKSSTTLPSRTVLAQTSKFLA